MHKSLVKGQERGNKCGKVAPRVDHPKHRKDDRALKSKTLALSYLTHIQNDKCI